MSSHGRSTRLQTVASFNFLLDMLLLDKLCHLICFFFLFSKYVWIMCRTDNIIVMNLKWLVRGFHYLCILYVLDFDKTGISYGKVSWQQKRTWVLLKWDDINRRVGFFLFFTPKTWNTGFLNIPLCVN